VVDLGVAERKLTFTIPPKTPHFQTAMIDIPKGEVWRIIKITSLTKPIPDVELSLQVSGVQRAKVNAGSIYSPNEANEAVEAFANYHLGHKDKAYFAARPLTPSHAPISLTFLLRIQKEELI
jgi:hypothetical protein